MGLGPRQVSESTLSGGKLEAGGSGGTEARDPGYLAAKGQPSAHLSFFKRNLCCVHGGRAVHEASTLGPG